MFSRRFSPMTDQPIVRPANRVTEGVSEVLATLHLSNPTPRRLHVRNPAEVREVGGVQALPVGVPLVQLLHWDAQVVEGVAVDAARGTVLLVLV